MEDEWTQLSVQGCLFRLPTKMVKSTDWILAKILTSEIPWAKTSDGQIYVDVDPTSFRLILGILSGIVSLSSGDADTLCGTDLTLLKATSRYLMLDKVTERVKGILTGHVEAIHEKDQEIAALKEKAEKLHDIESSFADVPIKVYECQAYRTHRSFNQCGCKSIFFGPISLQGTKSFVKIAAMTLHGCTHRSSV